MKIANGRRESHYDSPQEFLDGFRPSDTSDLKSVMVLFMPPADSKLWASVDLVRGNRQRPFVTASGDDPSLVEGLAKRLTDMFSGSNLRWQGLRREGEVSRLKVWQTRAGALGTLAVTVVVTVALTIWVTKFLG